MPAGNVVFERDQRMRRIGEIVEKNLNSGVRKRFADEPHNSLIIFKKLVRVVDDLLSVVFPEQLRVNFLLSRLELPANIVLLADENELTRRRMILVLEKVVHSEPKIVQIEFAKVLTRDCEGIKIVFLQFSPEFPATFLVFSPGETSREENERRDNGRDHVDSDLALQCANHAMSPIERSTIATPLQISSCI